LNHRLRTPILASERASGLLLQGDFGPLNAQQQEIVALIRENGHEINRLLSMLSDIFRYKNHSKRLNLDFVHAADLVVEAIESLNAKAASHKVKLKLENECNGASLFCDAEQMKVLFKHLVDNAIKHARTEVTVRTEWHQEVGFSATVTNDGDGIPPQDLGSLFDRFYVISSARQYAPVTGIGLCLCSEICRAHGGTIQCKSSMGQQTSFSIELPAVSALPSTGNPS
jgi:signal transduction histidine kinase